jgi:kynurenine formamidase
VLTEEQFRELAASVDRSRAWGNEDERGALNFLTPAATLAALREAEHGRVVSCADRGLASRIEITTSTDEAHSWAAVNETVSFRQHGAASMTHFDALGHFFYDGRGHGGADRSILEPHGVSTLDTTAASAGIVGRGILIDLPAVAGTRYLDADTFVSLADVQAWLERVELEAHPGDILFIRTGRPLAPAPEPGGYPRVGGPSVECAGWVHDERIALIISDAGLDSPTPRVENVATPWHVLALTRMGISLVDFADLEQLASLCASAGKYSFLAILSVLPLAKATASPVNPLVVL